MPTSSPGGDPHNERGDNRVGHAREDCFAFGSGISLGIPQSARPGICARVRTILQAEHLPGMLLGVTILAGLVNVVELLCTAGLQALYTQVLMLSKHYLAVNIMHTWNSTI